MGLSTSFIVRIIISSLIFVALVFLLFQIYGAFFGSQKDADWVAHNSFEELINLVNAQRGDAWEFKTFVASPVSHKIVGFGNANDNVPYWPQQNPKRPSVCEGACLCLYKHEDDFKIDWDRPMRCESLNANQVTHMTNREGDFTRRPGAIVGGSITQQSANARIIRVKLESGTMDFSDMTNALIPQEEPGLNEVVACMPERECCTAVTPESNVCIGRSIGGQVIRTTNAGAQEVATCQRQEVAGECKLSDYVRYSD